MKARNLKIEGFGIKLSAGQIGGGFTIIFLAIPMLAIGWQATPDLQYADNGRVRTIAGYMNSSDVKFVVGANMIQDLLSKVDTDKVQEELKSALKSTDNKQNLQIIVWYPEGINSVTDAAEAANKINDQLVLMGADSKRLVMAPTGQLSKVLAEEKGLKISDWGVALVQNPQEPQT